MAKLIEGIPGRSFDPDVEVTEDEVLLNPDADDTTDEEVDLYEIMTGYYVFDADKPPYRVEVDIEGGGTVVLSMNKREAKCFKENADQYIKAKKDHAEYERFMKEGPNKTQKAVIIFVKVVFAICVILAALIIFGKMFG